MTYAPYMKDVQKKSMCHVYKLISANCITYPDIYFSCGSSVLKSKKGTVV